MRNKLTRAVVTGLFLAASMHISVQPASADTKSFCAQLAAIELQIASSDAPDFAKSLAISAIYGTKKAAGCDQVTEY